MTSDFLVICTLGGGGGSYGRAPTKEKAIANCKRCLEQDWSGLFHLDGVTVKMNVFDVTGYEAVVWDDFGVRPDPNPDNIKTLDRLELVEVTLSVPKQRKRKARK